MKTSLKKIYLGTEFMLLFFGIPLLIFLDTEIIHPSMLVLPVLLFIFLILKFTTDFTMRELVYFRPGRRDIINNTLIIIIVGLLMLAGIYLFQRERLFDLPRGNILVWGILCTFYPVFSAYGQEIIYRTFLFRRYESLFKMKWAMVLASGTAFSFVHIVYYNPVSIILTFLGGLYLAHQYARTRSVLFTAILHGIWGIIVFTVGLGEYFWLDMYDWIGVK
jgi:membrane protease YdiL (CAAX protease family)